MYLRYKNVIEAIVITGCARGDIVLIPRITLIPTDIPLSLKEHNSHSKFALL